MHSKVFKQAARLSSAMKKRPTHSPCGWSRRPLAQLLALTFAAYAASAQAQDAAPAAPGSFAPGLKLPHAAPPLGRVAAAAQLEVETDRNRVQADARQLISVKVRLLDPQGRPLRGQTLLTVEAPGLRILQAGTAQDLRTDESGPGGSDAARNTPGVQIVAQDGVAAFQIIAPGEPKTVPLRVSGAGLSAAGELEFVPEVRHWLAAGLLEGLLRRRSESLEAQAQSRFQDGFERDMSRFTRQSSDGRTLYGVRGAAFAKGLLGDPAQGLMLTLAYDSDKDERSRFMRDLNPIEFYPIYGDAARTGFDARSAKRLYARLDAQHNYLMFGDFSTGDEIGFGRGLRLPPSFLHSATLQPAGAGPAQAASQSAAPAQDAGPLLRKLARYQRSATGVRGHYQQQNLGLNGFALYDSMKQAVEEYRANGTSGPFAVRNTQAIANSEKVEIIVRDKNQNDRVLQVTPLTRFEDYTFEPFDGRIVFKQAIPSLTPNGDPQSLRISYEVEQGGERFWVGGLDGEIKLSEDAVLAASVVEDRNPESPFRLHGLSLGWRIGQRSRLVAEWAHASATAYAVDGQWYSTPSGRSGEQRQVRSGDAGRLEFEHRGERWQLAMYWQKAQTGFLNSAGNISAGRTEAGLKLAVKAGDSVTLYLDGARSQDQLSQAERSSVRAGALAQLSPDLRLDVSLGHVHERGAPDAGALAASLPGNAQSGGGFFGAASADSIISPQTGNLITPVLSQGGAASPGADWRQDLNTLRLELQYRPAPNWLLAAQAEQGLQGGARHRYALGAQYTLNERSRAYARYEQQTGLASAYSQHPDQRSNSLIAGLESEFLPNTNVFTEYRLRDAQSVELAHLRDQQLATGLRNTHQLAPGLSLNSSAEYLKVLAGSQQTGFAVSAGLDYTAQSHYKASAKLEYRRLSDKADAPGDQRQQQWLSTLSGAFKLQRDYALLLRNYSLYTRNHDDVSGKPLGDIWQNRAQLGLAWRPLDHNRFNALLRYENKLVRDESGADGENYRAHIFSSHLDWHPARPWWLSGRLAAKRVRDFSLPAGQQDYSAWLLGGRLVYDVSENIDLGLLAARLSSAQGGARQYALGIEAGYLLKENVWLSLGYNKSGFTDRDLSAADYTARGVFMRLRFKFDETLFKGDDKNVNRSLAR
ncbi:hypothetical protein V8J88_16100 [Massilia sp. W12]|uniref:hypothetical protein n=1 Tax=Massilia sp. W12 TaxID=3126507 RepID=UPI0030CE7E48